MISDPTEWLESQLDGQLVSAADDAADGVAASRLAEFGNLDAMVGAVARALRALHDQPTNPTDAAAAGLPVGWDPLADAIQQRVADAKVRPETLPDPYNRYSADRLLEIWESGRPEDAVSLCHGEPMLDHLIVQNAAVDDTSVTAWVDRGAWRLIDRHHDLATIHHDVHRLLGPEAVFVFYDAYGLDPNLVRLDHFLLGNLLLGIPAGTMV